MTEYMLVQDDDDHWYIIPASKEVDWWEDIYPDDSPIRHIDVECDEVPDYAVRVGGSLAFSLI